MIRTTVVLLGLLLAGQAQAACEFDVEVGDMLQFSTAEMTVESSCETVTVTLKHTGTLPAAAMGHNWVLTKTADFEAVAQAGMGAGLEASYVPADDARVIAATKIVGGGESSTTSFSPADLEAGGSYKFFCSFPGHWSIMQGTLNIT